MVSNLPQTDSLPVGEWARLSSGYNVIRRQFPGGIPSLNRVRISRAVFEPSRLVLLVLFSPIPAGAVDDWTNSGYVSVDLRLDFGLCSALDVTASFFDSVSCFAEMSIGLEPKRLNVLSLAGGELLRSSWEVFHAGFYPDPVEAKSKGLLDLASDIRPRGRH
jgi:hypothetical protein